MDLSQFASVRPVAEKRWLCDVMVPTLQFIFIVYRQRSSFDEFHADELPFRCPVNVYPGDRAVYTGPVTENMLAMHRVSGKSVRDSAV